MNNLKDHFPIVYDEQAHEKICAWFTNENEIALKCFNHLQDPNSEDILPDGIEHDVALMIDEIIPEANIITKTYEYSQIMFSLIMAAKSHMQNL